MISGEDVSSSPLPMGDEGGMGKLALSGLEGDPVDDDEVVVSGDEAVESQSSTGGDGEMRRSSGSGRVRATATRRRPACNVDEGATQPGAGVIPGAFRWRARSTHVLVSVCVDGR